MATIRGLASSLASRPTLYTPPKPPLSRDIFENREKTTYTPPKTTSLAQSLSQQAGYDPDIHGSWLEQDLKAPGSLDIMQLSSLGLSPTIGGGWAGVLPPGIGPGVAEDVLGLGLTAGDFLYDRAASDVGIGDGGGAAVPQPTPITWSVGNYKAFGPNVPTWWKPMVPQGTAANERPDVQFSLMMNAMIPYVSPEDQVTVARKLYEIWGDQFGIYKQVGIKGTRVSGGLESVGRAPISREQQQRGIEGQLANEQFFKGPQRADFARQTLESVRQNVTKDIGVGGRFMEDILSAISQTGGGRTRASTVEMLGQIDPMLAGAQAGALSPFGPLGKMTASPFFSKFQQQPVQRTETGEFIFGKPSKLLQF